MNNDDLHSMRERRIYRSIKQESQLYSTIWYAYQYPSESIRELNTVFGERKKNLDQVFRAPGRSNTPYTTARRIRPANRNALQMWVITLVRFTNLLRTGR